MRALIVTDESVLVALNNQCRSLVPVLDSQGRKVLNADLLTDCGEGQTWEDYASILTGLAVEDVELPQPEVIVG